MRILFISRYLPFTGGRETFVCNLINHLKGTHQVGLVTPDGLVGEGFSLFKYDENNLKNIIEEFKPDIINSHTHYLSESAASVAKELKIPFILTLHGDIFTIGSEENQEKFRQLLTDKVSCLVTVSGQGEDSVRKNIQNSSLNIQVIHNGVDTKKFENDFLSKEPSKTYLRSIYDIPNNKFIIITPARMAWYKGLDFLARTISTNKEYLRANGIYFLITTPGTRFQEEELSYLNNLTSFTRSSGIEDLIKIIFASYDYMPILYRMVDGFILPSVSEQFPISILESMASGIPVIATNVGGIPEIVRKDIDGLTVGYSMDDELADAIKIVFKDKQKVSGLVVRAREKVEKQFTMDKAAHNYVSLFEDLLASKTV